MKNWKRRVALLLSVILLTGSIAGPVFAFETGTPYELVETAELDADLIERDEMDTDAGGTSGEEEIDDKEMFDEETLDEDLTEDPSGTEIEEDEEENSSVTLDANGGNSVNEGDDVPGESEEGTEILNKQMKDGQKAETENTEIDEDNVGEAPAAGEEQGEQIPEDQPEEDSKATEAIEIIYSDGVTEESCEEPKGAAADIYSVEDILSLPVIETDVTSASTDCVLVAVPGTYISDPDAALERINQIRLEACQEGVLNPDTGEPLTTDDYVPIKWSKDLEYIARIRAAESAFTGAHARTNGKSGQNIFGLCSPDGVRSFGECIAWNWTSSVIFGIDQWYDEKEDWVNQNSGAVTGHYTQMIAPSHIYVGLGTFCSQSVGYYNTTVAEYSFKSDLDESRMAFAGDCMQILEMKADNLSGEGEILGKLNGVIGEECSHLLATKASYDFAYSDVYLLDGVTWSSSDANVVQVSSDGKTTVTGVGSAVISASSSDGKIAGEATFFVTEIGDCSIELSKTEYIYDGEEKRPTVTVTHHKTVLQEGTDYTLSYSDNINAGTAKVTVTGAGGSYAGSKTASFMIQKAPQTVTARPWTDVLGIYLTTGSTVSGFGYITYSSSDPSIAKVGSDGWLEGVGDGTAVITVTASGDANHLKGQTTFEITVKSVYEVASGPCGDDASWTYYNNGTVEINGTGTIELKRNSSGDYLWDRYYKPVPFSHYEKVDTVIINEGITGIGSEVFSESQSNGIGRMSDSPVTIVIADSVETISERAFIYCRNLEKVTIGSGLKELGDCAFSYCPSLKEFSVPEDNSYFTVVDGALYSKDKKTLYKLPNGGRTEYVIPEETVVIGVDAMGNMDSLKNLTVPKSVTEFKKYALDGCNSLTDVFYKGTASRWATLSIGEYNDVLDAVNCHFAESEKPVGNCSVTLGQTSFVYDGEEKKPSVTVADDKTQLEEGFHYQIVYDQNVDAGTAEVTITGLVDYAGTVTRSFKIDPASIADAAVTGIVNRMYTGLEQTQNPIVEMGGRKLENGKDYELSYTNNTDIGTATVTITGKGNYVETVSRTFTISAASIAGAAVTGLVDKTYDGSAQTQNLIVKVGDKTLVNETDYTLSYSDNTNAGTATVIITGKGNYNKTVSRTFAINAASIVNADITGILNKTYTGSAQTQNPNVKVGDKTLTNGTDYTLSYSNNINIGTATVTITGKGNYTGTVSETFTIGGISIADAVVTGISPKTYTGFAQTQNPVVKVGDKTLSKDTDYTISYSDNIDAGTATMTIAGMGNYAEIIVKTFTITPASIETATVTEITDRKYDGSAQTQTPVVKMGDKTLKEGTDYTITYSDNISAGTATVAVTGMGNYSGTKSASFTIEKASQMLEASDLSLTYPKGGKITASGNMGTLSYTSLNTAIATVDAFGNVTVKGAGTAKIRITASEADNFNEAVKEITVTVAKGKQAISVKSSAASVAVGKKVTVSSAGAHGKVTYKSSDTSVAAVNASTGAVTAKKVGTVKITVTAAETEDYNAASAKVTIKVVPAATTSLTTENQAKGIKLTWKKVTGATGFLVYRGSSKIATIKSGSTLTFTDTKAKKNGTKYTYKVIAAASTGNSTLSKSLTTYYVAAPTVKTAKSTVAKKADVIWGKNAKASGYEIEYSLKKNFSGADKVTVTKKDTVKTTLTGLAGGKTYYVRIRTYMKNGSSKYYSTWSEAKAVSIKK